MALRRGGRGERGNRRPRLGCALPPCGLRQDEHGPRAGRACAPDGPHSGRRLGGALRAAVDGSRRRARLRDHRDEEGARMENGARRHRGGRAGRGHAQLRQGLALHRWCARGSGAVPQGLGRGLPRIHDGRAARRLVRGMARRQHHRCAELAPRGEALDDVAGALRRDNCHSPERRAEAQPVRRPRAGHPREPRERLRRHLAHLRRRSRAQRHLSVAGQRGLHARRFRPCGNRRLQGRPRAAREHYGEGRRRRGRHRGDDDAPADAGARHRERQAGAVHGPQLRRRRRVVAGHV
mmetsp:Transcript_51234/g.147924  ORF Transcript_51234/g.147924 Transcript_51234/m.147924 type:complete len:294 (+) Transcript_51234:313-1194(+)